MLVVECSTVCSRNMDADSDRRRLEAFQMWIWRINQSINQSTEFLQRPLQAYNDTKNKVNQKQKHRPMKDNAYRQDVGSLYQEGC